MVVYEIEDNNGNILLAFRINDNNGEIEQLLGCSLADKDADYIFNTKDKLVRIQMDKESD